MQSNKIKSPRKRGNSDLLETELARKKFALTSKISISIISTALFLIISPVLAYFIAAGITGNIHYVDAAKDHIISMLNYIKDPLLLILGFLLKDKVFS